MSDFLMPSLGADMEAGTLVEWLKRPGDRVTRGDVVAVVETQKGAIEIEIFEDGTIDELLVAPGTTVPVGTKLARLSGGAAAPAKPAPPPPPAVPAVTAAPAAVPAKPAPAQREALASPAARRFAAERGIDLTGIKGSGPGGAIVSADLEPAAAAPAPAAPAAPTPVTPTRRGLDFEAMRQAIGAAMARSKREIPHYYLGTAIDMHRAQRWLADTNATRPPTERLLLGALLLKAVALALRRSPELNGFHVEGAFRPSAAIHVGMAVAIRGGGLVAPAIHDTAERSLDDLMRTLRDLVARVRTGTLRSSELTDSTVTLTSLGERGVESIQAVIYPPQVAIVGFGKLVERPWAVGGALAVRPVIQASLAADHRVSDGHRGALFLAEIDRLLQEPERL